MLEQAIPGKAVVIKASAGTLFRAPVLRCDALVDALPELLAAGATVCSLDGTAETSLFDYREPPRVVFVLGGESEGVSAAARKFCEQTLAIPMRNDVESLNVAVTAALIAFRQ